MFLQCSFPEAHTVSVYLPAEVHGAAGRFSSAVPAMPCFRFQPGSVRGDPQQCPQGAPRSGLPWTWQRLLSVQPPRCSSLRSSAESPQDY